jgi:hypothetical protein
MGWNKYYIFVKSPKMTDLNEILSKLNLTEYKPTKEVPLHFSNKPQTLFTGFYNGNLLVVHPDLPFQFFSDTPTDTEKLFIDTFPDSEIAVLIENSTVGLFSYAIIDSGRKIRMKDGSDGEIYHDEGEQLPEEQEILSEKIFGDDEIEEMKEDGMSDEEVDAMIKFEASWRVPNRLTKRYLGEPVSLMDTDKVMLTMYE